MQTVSRDQSVGCVTCSKSFHIREFGLDHKNPKRFVTLEFGRPVLYLPWAIFWAIYHCIWIVLEAYWWSLKTHRAPLEWLLKLTNIGYVILTSAAIAECFIAVYTYCFLTAKDRESQTGMSWYCKLSWVLHNISHPTALLIALSYWTMLSNFYTIKIWTINKHGINLLYTFLLLIFTSKPIKFQHVYFPMVFSFLYLLFTWMYFLATDDVIYSFLNWNKPGKSIMLTILYVFVCTPLAHFSIFGTYKLKQYFKQKCSSEKTVGDTRISDTESKEEMLRSDTMEN
ncbi:protein rolling stone-like [Ostrea edulis]|uniref:protein rolling stone-like n=1 Tax=Ostrea edulis TaxID=37623 RepID=UPI0024AFD9F0|nr:protein rolling stone-like [Ostrea edulis]XP_055998987.1 protein rolling stone-like [Ostrea edulis]